jgi:phenylalanyl-tRNA synthetase beta chain
VTGAALAEDPTAADAVAEGSDRVEDHARVEIADPEICPRFTARVFEDVRIGPSPPWLKQRLTAAGQRPISNVVDITNYVMLLYGQPLHAFDLDRVRGRSIVVRRAREGERMTTLDGDERTSSPEVALVCDAEGPSGIAGVMGGAVSEVSSETTRVLMESATWVGPNIMRTSRALGLRTEASARFEKGLHPEGAIAAQRLAAKLMVELCGARLVPGTIDAYPRPAEPRTVGLRPERIESLLGEKVPEDEVREVLGRLGFEPVGDDAAAARIEVSVPAFRDGDVQREADLIEEVARIHGLDRLPGTLPARRSAVGRLTPAQRLRRRLEDALRDRGLSEVVAYSFTSAQALARLRLEDSEALCLRNPLSADGALLRPLLLPGLLDAAAHNAAHGRAGLALFESAHVYSPGDRHRSSEADGPSAPPADPSSSSSPRGARPAHERHHLAGLLSEAAPATWRAEARPADFYAAKAVVKALLAVAGVKGQAERAEPAAQPFLHPGRTAVVTAADGRELGWIGELHPLVAREWEVPAAAVFELDADALAELAPAAGERGYRDLTSFPAVTQDLAVIVAEETSAAEVERAVRAGGGELLRSVQPFDLYRGDQLGPGRKSLALRLEFRALDRTLTEGEVAERRSAIEAALAEIGGGPCG